MSAHTDSNPSTIVRPATSPEDIRAVADLIRGFVAWLQERYGELSEGIDHYFEGEALEEELQNLPGKEYSHPDGVMLILRSDGEAAGCVCLQRISADACEMKRMFVSSQFHGKGFGKLMGEALIQHARDLGYKAMRLETGFMQEEAIALYKSLGFTEIQPYHDHFPELQPFQHFMELSLI